MNNTCPTCGALYNVATKDIGRKIKCKKCGTALAVTDAGLVVDAGSAVAPAVPAAAAAPAPAPARAKAAPAEFEVDDDDDRESVVKKKKGKYERTPGAGIDVLSLIPTVIFAFGVFLVIVFSSFPVIGEAAVERASMGVKQLEIERDAKIKSMEPKKEPDKWTAEERTKLGEDRVKIHEDYRPKLEAASMDARKTAVGNVRDRWLERYGLMFGFIVVAFGCLGFLKMENPLVLKIVAAVILCFMMMVMFSAFGGCGGKSSSPIPPLTGGKGGGID